MIVAIEGSGMVLGVAIAKELDKPFAAVRPHPLRIKSCPAWLIQVFTRSGKESVDRRCGSTSRRDA